MTTNPTCGLCGKVMTPQNSTVKPEFFICDSCATTKLHSDDLPPTETEEQKNARKDQEIMRYKYIVVQGNIVTGFYFYGPFNSRDAAKAWMGKKNKAGVIQYVVSPSHKSLFEKHLEELKQP